MVGSWPWFRPPRRHGRRRRRRQIYDPWITASWHEDQRPKQCSAPIFFTNSSFTVFIRDCTNGVAILCPTLVASYDIPANRFIAWFKKKSYNTEPRAFFNTKWNRINSLHGTQLYLYGDKLYNVDEKYVFLDAVMNIHRVHNAWAAHVGECSAVSHRFCVSLDRSQFHDITAFSFDTSIEFQRWRCFLVNFR